MCRSIVSVKCWSRKVRISLIGLFWVFSVCVGYLEPDV